MEEKEKIQLYQKILQVATDAKSAKIAAKTLINQGKREDAEKFLEYLDTSDLAIRKMARYILGQMGCRNAFSPLQSQLLQSIKGLTFFPDEEYREAKFFTNIIEIVEALYGIVRLNDLQDEELRLQLLEIFKRTKHEDLRFSLIKLIAVSGESGEFFYSVFKDLTTKERRAIYHVYSYVDSVRRMDFFSVGLQEDSLNHEFLIRNMLEFPQGKQALIAAVPQMLEKQKVYLLTALLENISADFLPSYIELLDDENRQVVQLATDNIKALDIDPFPIDLFLTKIKTGYSFEMIKAATSVFEHFVDEKREEYLLDALISQPLFNNKAVILDALMRTVKGKKNVDAEFSKKIVKILLEYFKSYAEERLEFLQTVLKILPGLTYTQSIQVRSIKKELLIFMKYHEKQMNQTLINNIQECVARLNQLSTHFEEAEEKIKHIEVLFDLEPQSIDVPRLEKLKVQLAELSEISPDFLKRFGLFLTRMLKEADDWKIRSISAELLAEYGTADYIPQLALAKAQDQSLGVRVAATKALERIQANYKTASLDAVVIEPLFYISKLINVALEEHGYQVNNYKEWPDDSVWNRENCSMIWVSEQLIENGSSEKLKLLEKQLTKQVKKVIIITQAPAKYADLENIPGFVLLQKPFTKDFLNDFFSRIF